MGNFTGFSWLDGRHVQSNIILICICGVFSYNEKGLGWHVYICVYVYVVLDSIQNNILFNEKQFISLCNEHYCDVANAPLL